MTRAITSRYRDPLDELWTETARRIGFRIKRSSDVFASSDGRGQITIAEGEHLDDDDSLAQMIFHEICHSLVQGHESFSIPDWGLENTDARDEVREHACLRAQAHLGARHGLRLVLAPTTDFRSFYDALGEDPLLPRESESSQLARIAIGRAERSPWNPHLAAALVATATIARAGTDLLGPQSLLAHATEPVGVHSTGIAVGWVQGRQCGSCGWRGANGHCVIASAEVDATERACERHEPLLDCSECGACCREGYESVTVAATDPITTTHPELVVDRNTYLEIRRDGPRCAALDGELGTFSCRIYPDRPLCCRELELAGQHCLTARRRVGLSL